MNRAVLLLMALVAGMAGAFAGWWYASRTPQPPMLSQGTLLPQARPLPGFELLDQRGDAYTREQLRGRWTLVFFGFTSCPDVCPATLGTLAAVRRQLSDLPAADQPAVVMVSVDPERDTPDRLAPYLRHFDPEFTGLTGPPGAIAALARDLGIAVRFGAPDEHGNYTVDHTAAVLLLNRDAAMAGLFGAPHVSAAISSDYRAALAYLE